MIDEIRAARDAALADIAAATTFDQVVAIDQQALGKRGPLATIKTGLGALATVEERKAAGQALNEAHAELAAAIDGAPRRARRGRARRPHRRRTARPHRARRSQPARGHAHIVTQAWERLEDVFVGLGFQVAEGPEVETDWHNFEALNMPAGHPARSEFDTLFVDHAGAPPGTHRAAHAHVAGADPRDARRRAADLHRRPRPGVPARHARRHAHAGVPPDRGTGDRPRHQPRPTWPARSRRSPRRSSAAGFTSRLRPSYFPFTEPSGEFDIRTPSGEWLELGGCGMVHPNVLRAGGIDPERVERVRLRLRHRPHGEGAPPGRRPP